MGRARQSPAQEPGSSFSTDPAIYGGGVVQFLLFKSPFEPIFKYSPFNKDQYTMMVGVPQIQHSSQGSQDGGSIHSSIISVHSSINTDSTIECDPQTWYRQFLWRELHKTGAFRIYMAPWAIISTRSCSYVFSRGCGGYGRQRHIGIAGVSRGHGNK